MNFALSRVIPFYGAFVAMVMLSAHSAFAFDSPNAVAGRVQALLNALQPTHSSLRRNTLVQTMPDVLRNALFLPQVQHWAVDRFVNLAVQNMAGNDSDFVYAYIDRGVFRPSTETVSVAENARGAGASGSTNQCRILEARSNGDGGTQHWWGAWQACAVHHHHLRFDVVGSLRRAPLGSAPTVVMHLGIYCRDSRFSYTESDSPDAVIRRGSVMCLIENVW